MKTRRVRRTHPSLISRVRVFWLMGMLLFAAACFGIVQVIRWPGFFPSRIEVLGAGVVDPAEIRQRAAIDRQSNLWLQNMRAVVTRVESIPYVATARVRRALPARVRIVVTERHPDGCVWGADDARFTVDAADRVLETGCAAVAEPVYVAPTLEEPVPGVFLHSSRLARLQTDAHILAALQPNTYTRVSFDKYDGLDAIMRKGVRVRFGDDTDLPVKVKLIDPILNAVAGRFKKTKVVDVRAPSTPVVEYDN